jgi:SWI/SNF-related matrix-associated actin-dependent regulator of chromatin subfamily A3
MITKELTDNSQYSLNLTVASRIYLLEPQWNPFIESQAIGRALRLGQTQQVSVIRYIMAGTVEKVIHSIPFMPLLLDLQLLALTYSRL